MSNASELWNKQPLGTRRRLLGVMIKRAKSAHAKHMKEVRQHLANVKASYAKWEQEYIDAGEDSHE